MRKFIIIWLTFFIGIAIWAWLDKKLKPIEVPVPYEVIVEKIVEKPIFKGEKIVEKIIHQPTEVEGIFVIQQISEPEGYDLAYTLKINTSRNSIVTMRPSQEDECLYLFIKHQEPSSQNSRLGKFCNTKCGYGTIANGL